MCFAQLHFAQGVQIGTAAAAEGKIRRVKQIQFSSERRLRPARALGHRRDAPEIRREPVDDETGFRERSRPQNEAGGGFDHLILGGENSGEIAPRLTMYLMPSATVMSSFVTFSSGTRIKNPEVGFGVVGIKTQTTFSFGFLLHFAVLFARDEADGINSRAAEIRPCTTVLNEFLLPDKRLVDLLDGAVNFVQHRHAHHQPCPSHSIIRLPK